MDSTESQALAFLQSRGLSDIFYEPDGNVPPDFACGHIGIEVRRLNQHDESGAGLEVSAVPLMMKFRNLLTSLGPPQDASWFVMFRFRRPVESWATLSPKIKAALLTFAGDPADGVSRITISDEFSFGLARASEKHETLYLLGGYTDHNAGGWIVSELIKNLAIVIPEKSAKIERFRSRYREWWLVLLDHIGYASLDAHEIDTLRQHVQRPAEWDRIFLVNPLNPERAIDI